VRADIQPRRWAGAGFKASPMPIKLKHENLNNQNKNHHSAKKGEGKEVERKCVMGFGGQRPLLITCRYVSLVADTANWEAVGVRIVAVEMNSSRIEVQTMPSCRIVRWRYPAVTACTDLAKFAIGVESQAAGGEE